MTTPASTVNPHLFRHIGAQTYLTENPGGYEVVRRVLAHKSMATTTSFYTGLETRQAGLHFAKTIEACRRRPNQRPVHERRSLWSRQGPGARLPEA